MTRPEIEEVIELIYKKGELNGARAVQEKALKAINNKLGLCNVYLKSAEFDGDIARYQAILDVKCLIESIRKVVEDICK